MKKFLILFLMVSLIFMSVSEKANAALYVNSCTTISQSNQEIILTQDIVKSSRTGYCFYISNGNLNNITIDLGGHTILWDTWPIVAAPNPSFEIAKGADQTEAQNWNFASAPNAYRSNNAEFYRFGGNYTLVFPAGIAPQYVESDSITLEGGVEYAFYFLFKPTDDTSPYYLYGAIPQIPTACASPIVQNAGPATTWSSYVCKFTPATTITVNLRIGNGLTTDREYSIDTVDIKPVLLPGSEVIRVSGSGAKSNIVIRNGSIIQGPAKSFGDDIDANFPVLIAGTPLTNSRIHNLIINTSSIELVPLNVKYSNNVSIYNNILSATTPSARRRDRLYSVIYLSSDTATYPITNTFVYNNTIRTYQNAIRTAGSALSFEFYNNTILHDSLFANSYAIKLDSGYTSAKIHHNTITGNGRGMHIVTGSGAEVYNNYLNLKEMPNGEYLNWVSYKGPCAQGIGLEAGETNYPTNFYIHDNNVTITQYEGTFGGCPLSMALNYNPGNNFNGRIENNHFISLTYYDQNRQEETPSAIFVNGLNTPNNLVIKGNIFETNTRGALWVNLFFGTLFDSNTFKTTNTGYTNYFLHDEMGSTIARMGDLTFLNTTTVNFDLSDSYHRGGDTWNYFVKWYLTINVRDGLSNPLSNAAVVVRDRNNQQVFSQTTGANGQFVLNLTEYEMLTNNIQSFTSPYTVQVTYSGNTQSRPVTLDQSKTELFTFSSGACTLPFDNTPCNCMTLGELNNAINSWYADQIAITVLMQHIRQWKSQLGC